MFNQLVVIIEMLGGRIFPKAVEGRGRGGICGERRLGGDSCVGCNGDQQLLAPAV